VGGAAVVLVEGVNVLQDPPAGPEGPDGPDGSGRASVADQLDLGLYVDAAEPDLRAWYRRRVARLRAEATGDGSSFYDAFAGLDDDAFGVIADQVWEQVNLPNLIDHILPSRQRADLVVVKASDHSVRQIDARTERARALVAAVAGDAWAGH
jgi:type I pantothenate kinase